MDLTKFVWVNKKTGGRYRIWFIAREYPNGLFFVVYSNSNVPDKAVITVQDTEFSRLGTAGLYLNHAGQPRWSIHWHNGERNGTREAWASPCTLWAKKFQPIAP